MTTTSNDYIIREQDSLFVVASTISGETISATFATRELAWQCIQQIRALPENEQRAIVAGRRVAPGCDWLVERTRP